MKHFINGEAKNVAVHGGNAAEVVILAVFADAVVDLWEVRDHPVDERLGKFAHARSGGTKLPEFVHPLRRAIAMQIPPEMELHCRLPRCSPLSHNNYLPRRFPITSQTETAARAASVPRLISEPRQRSCACASVSKLKTALITGTPCSTAMS
jgi:hypothetical protein